MVILFPVNAVMDGVEKLAISKVNLTKILRIHLLVQKTVVHNFLRIPKSTLPTLPSTVEVESSRSSTQTMTSTSSNILEIFV